MLGSIPVQGGKKTENTSPGVRVVDIDTPVIPMQPGQPQNGECHFILWRGTKSLRSLKNIADGLGIGQSLRRTTCIDCASTLLAASALRVEDREFGRAGWSYRRANQTSPTKLATTRHDPLRCGSCHESRHSSDRTDSVVYGMWKPDSGRAEREQMLQRWGTYACPACCSANGNGKQTPKQSGEKKENMPCGS